MIWRLFLNQSAFDFFLKSVLNFFYIHYLQSVCELMLFYLAVVSLQRSRLTPNSIYESSVSHQAAGASSQEVGNLLSLSSEVTSGLLGAVEFLGPNSGENILSDPLSCSFELLYV